MKGGTDREPGNGQEITCEIGGIGGFYSEDQPASLEYNARFPKQELERPWEAKEYCILRRL